MKCINLFHSLSRILYTCTIFANEIICEFVFFLSFECVLQFRFNKIFVGIFLHAFQLKITITNYEVVLEIFNGSHCSNECIYEAGTPFNNRHVNPQETEMEWKSDRVKCEKSAAKLQQLSTPNTSNFNFFPFNAKRRHI